MTPSETLAWLEELGEFRMKLDTERLAAVLERLENPQARFPAVHIAGTNGKGTTAWYSEALLRGAGLSTGLFTSPHLERPHERIVVNGDPIDDVGFAACATRVRDAIDAAGTSLTYFEVLTAMAASHFADVGVDVAVFEVGLGGRHDATRVVEPIVSIITAIGLDHTHILGDDVGDIAAEKAEILRAGVLGLCAAREPAAVGVIHDRAAELGAPLLIVGQHFGFRGATLVAPGVEVADVRVAMPGAHNRDNAAVAATAAWKACAVLECELPETVIRSVLESLRVPARHEWLPGRPVLIDGAHNAQALGALVEVLAPELDERRWVLLFAAMQDKDLAGMAEELAGLPPPGALVLTAVEAHGRQAEPAALAEWMPAGWPEPQCVVPVEQALTTAVQAAGEQGCVVATGSFYLAGAIRALLREGA